MVLNSGEQMGKAIFEKQLSKGKIGEAWFRTMADQHCCLLYTSPSPRDRG